MQVLIVKTSSMGDVIHTLPAVTDAVRAVPGIRFDWVVEEDFSEIPAWHPGVDRVIPVALRRWKRHPYNALSTREWKRFYKGLRDRKYDKVIDVQGLMKSAFLAVLARGPAAGLDRGSIREPVASLLYRERFFVEREDHAIQRTRNLFAAALGYGISLNKPDYGIDKSRFPKLPLRQDFLIFISGTSRKEKMWPVNNWMELAKTAKQHGFFAQLPWGNDSEKKTAERIAASCKGVVVLPKKNLNGIASIMLASQGVVSVDTGLSHLAAVLGVPAVTLYLYTSPKLVGTLGDHQHHLRKEEISPAAVWQKLKNYLK